MGMVLLKPLLDKAWSHIVYRYDVRESFKPLNIDMDTIDETIEVTIVPDVVKNAPVPKRDQKHKLTAKQQKAIDIALSTGSMTKFIKEFRNNKAAHNRNFNSAVTKHGALTLIAMGYTTKEAADMLGVSASLIRSQCIHDKEFGELMVEARMQGADADFDQMKEIAYDTSLPVADRRLIIEVLEKRTKINHRARFGDKVQVDHKQVVINLDKDDLSLV